MLILTILNIKLKKNESKKDTYSCYGFEWKQCEDSQLDILDESNCPIIEEQVPIKPYLVGIELDDSLLDRFNQLSEDELKDYFGTFAPVESLNPYMTKLSICSIEQARLELLILRIGFIRESLFKSHIRFKSQLKGRNNQKSQSIRPKFNDCLPEAALTVRSNVFR